MVIKVPASGILRTTRLSGLGRGSAHLPGGDRGCCSGGWAGRYCADPRPHAEMEICRPLHNHQDHKNLLVCLVYRRGACYRPHNLAKDYHRGQVDPVTKLDPLDHQVAGAT